MKNTQGFLERFNRWKNGAPIQELYNAGRPIAFDEGKDQEGGKENDPALRAALEYAISLKLDEFDEGKDKPMIDYIKEDSPLSYGKYYDVTGDPAIDAMLPRFTKGKSATKYESAPDMIKPFEGFKSMPYKNKKDVWTVGYGTTDPKWIARARKQGGLSEEEATEALNEHLNNIVIPELQRRVPGYNDMPQGMQIVLQDILYNVGSGNLFDKSPNFMKALSSKDYWNAPRHMDWDNNKEGYKDGARKRNMERQNIWKQAYDSHMRATNPIYAEVSSIGEPVQKEAPRQIGVPVSTYVAPQRVNRVAKQRELMDQLPYGSAYKGETPFTLTASTRLPNIIDVIENYNRFWNSDVPILQMPK